MEKYGLVPKAVWPEAFTSGRSMRLRKIMNYKVHNYTFTVALLRPDIYLKQAGIYLGPIIYLNLLLPVYL